MPPRRDPPSPEETMAFPQPHCSTVFCPSTYENHRVALFKLRQSTTVTAYQAEFERLCSYVTGLPPAALLDCFLSGLRSDVQSKISLHHPTTLHQAYGLAKLIEEKNAANRPRYPYSRPSPTPTVTPRSNSTSFTPPSTPSSPSLSLSATPTASVPPVAHTALPLRRLSHEEVQKRKSQGLCFRCPEKYHSGHKCNPPQFLILETSEPIPLSLSLADDTPPPDFSSSASEEIPETDHTQFLALSPAALHGSPSPRALRLTGAIAGHPVSILVDCGSTHNILHPRLATFLQLTTDPTPSFPIMIGDGSFIQCTGVCSVVPLQLANITLSLSLYLLPIAGADLVLGLTWLSSLGPISADFSIPKLTFQHNNQPISLEGEPPTASVSSSAINHILHKNAIHSFISFFLNPPLPLRLYPPPTPFQPLTPYYTPTTHFLFPPPLFLLPVHTTTIFLFSQTPPRQRPTIPLPSLSETNYVRPHFRHASSRHHQAQHKPVFLPGSPG